MMNLDNPDYNVLIAVVICIPVAMYCAQEIMCGLLFSDKDIEEMNKNKDERK